MPTVTLQNPTGGTAGDSVELPAEIFDAQTNVALIHQVVVGQLAAARQGTHDTKNRGEVAGGGKKPYRQKGTGRARQGSTRAPQFAGGGTVHGPTPRNYDQRTPKKMKAAALRGALSDRARNNLVHVVSSLVEGSEPSTRDAVRALAGITQAKRVLVVAQRSDVLTWKSLRNVESVHLLDPGQLNTYDVLISDEVVFTRAALDAFVAGPARGRSSKGAASSAEVGDLAGAEAIGIVEAVDTVAVGAAPVEPAGAPADGAAESEEETA